MPTHEKAREYALLKRHLWLLDLAVTTLLLAGLITSGVAQSLRCWVTARIVGWPAQVALYTAFLWILMEVLLFPLDWFRSFTVEHRFNLSTQKFLQWLWEYSKQMILAGAIGLGFVEGFSLLLRKAPAHWWIWATFFWMVWSAFLSWIGPTVLIPIFYKQSRLKDAALQRRLESFVRRCGTQVQGIFELNLSKTTRKANACLCGLGTTRRVLVSDTLLDSYPPEEIEVVLAHEMGHHQLYHIGILIAVSTLAAGLSCFWVDQMVRRWAPIFRLTGLNDLAALPFIALGLFVIGLLLMPITQGISRYLENQADRFALKKTGNPTAFIATMRRLAEQNLAEMDPPRWVEWLLYDHPPIRKRIALAQNFSGATGKRG